MTLHISASALLLPCVHGSGIPGVHHSLPYPFLPPFREPLGTALSRVLSVMCVCVCGYGAGIKQNGLSGQHARRGLRDHQSPPSPGGGTTVTEVTKSTSSTAAGTILTRIMHAWSLRDPEPTGQAAQAGVCMEGAESAAYQAAERLAPCRSPQVSAWGVAGRHRRCQAATCLTSSSRRGSPSLYLTPIMESWIVVLGNSYVKPI